MTQPTLSDLLTAPIQQSLDLSPHVCCDCAHYRRGTGEHEGRRVCVAGAEPTRHDPEQLGCEKWAFWVSAKCPAAKRRGK